MFDEIDIREEVRRAKLTATEGRDMAEQVSARIRNRIVRVFPNINSHTHAILNFTQNGGFTTIEIDAHAPISRSNISVFIDGSLIFQGFGRLILHEAPFRAGGRHQVRLETASNDLDVKISVTGNGVRILN